MDNNNNPNFPNNPAAGNVPDPAPSSPATTPPTPVPTWPLTSSTPGVATPTEPNTSWPSTPQDHGTTSTAGSWDPSAQTSPTPTFTPPTDPSTPAPSPATQPWDPSATPSAADPAAPLANPTTFQPSSVFPPQFTQASSDPTSAPAPAAPADPTPLAWSPLAGMGQSTSTPSSSTSIPPFAPPVETSTPDHLAPTVPDFLSGLSTAEHTPSAPTSSQTGGLNLSATAQTGPTASDQISSSTPDVQPTDFSQMTGTPQPNLPASPVYTPSVSSPEGTTPVAPGGIPESVNNNGKTRMSKWLIIAGVLVVLLAAAAGTYFFLSQGKSPEQNFSIPANQPPLTTPKQIAPTAPPASGSGTEATQSGTSAFDKLKKDKQATPTASPR